MLLAALLDAWNRAGEAANSLRETLVGDIVSARAFVKSGSLASVGKNSTSQAYKSYGPGSHTHVQEVEMLVSLLSYYDRVKSKIQAEFIASADFDYTEPAGFDYDAPVYNILNSIFTQASAGSGYTLPDISDMRVPEPLPAESLTVAGL